MKAHGTDGKVTIGGKEFGITEWSVDLIAPATFYFDGKPFEMNDHGIYLPAVSIESAKMTHPNFAVEIPLAAQDLSLGKLLAQHQKHIADGFGIPEAFYGIPVIVSPFAPDDIIVFDGKPFKQVSLPLPKFGPSPLAGFANDSIFDAISAYKQNYLESSAFFFGNLLCGMHFTPPHKPFICDHDDAHLFTRQATKSHAEAFDEQEALRGLHGTQTGYAWSEVLKAHVPIC